METVSIKRVTDLPVLLILESNWVVLLYLTVLYGTHVWVPLRVGPA